MRRWLDGLLFLLQRCRECRDLQNRPRFQHVWGLQVIEGDDLGLVDAKPLGECIEGLAALGDDVDPSRGRWLSRRRRGYNRVFTTATSSQQRAATQQDCHLQNGPLHSSYSA